MDPVVSLPAMSNLSLAAGNDTELDISSADNSSCTALNEMKLSNMFSKMDIGGDEFWGEVNVVWMGFFITYCVLFYASLSVLFCIYFWLLVYAAKEAYLL